MSSRLKKGLIAGGAVAVLGIGGGAIAVATGGGDDDGKEKRITGPALQRASDAALDHVGDGRVTETEVRDEEGFYEVEVTRDGGVQVEVHLDQDFNVVSTEGDSGEDEDEG